MSRILSPARLGRKNAWVLGMGVAVSLAAGCGSKGDDSGDDGFSGTGGAYRPPTQGGNGAGGIIYLSGQGGNRPTGGRGQGGNVFGQGGFVFTGGRATNTAPSTCITGTANCACYTSGTCGSDLTCVNKICVGTNASTGGAAATGGSKATTGGTSSLFTSTGGSHTTGSTQAPLGGTSAATVGGASSAVGGAATGGAPTSTGGTSPFVTTGGAPADGGVAEGGGVAVGGASGTVVTRCGEEVTNSPNGTIACNADCQFTGTLVNGATLSYECDCASNHYVCFAGSNTTVACPASIALEKTTACSVPADEFCTLTATKTTADGGTTTITPTTYACACSATDKVWRCTK